MCSTRWLNKSARASERDDTKKSVPPFSVRKRVSEDENVRDEPLSHDSELTLPEDNVKDRGSPEHLVQKSFHRVNSVQNLKAWVYKLQRSRQMYHLTWQTTYHQCVQLPTEGRRERAAAMTPLGTRQILYS